jgi:hypothetical protein
MPTSDCRYSPAILKPDQGGEKRAPNGDAGTFWWILLMAHAKKLARLRQLVASAGLEPQ